MDFQQSPAALISGQSNVPAMGFKMVLQRLHLIQKKATELALKEMLHIHSFDDLEKMLDELGETVPQGSSSHTRLLSGN